MRIKIVDIICPLVTLLAIVFIWSLYLHFFKVPDYILPPPKSVLLAFVQAFSNGFIWNDIAFTLQSTVLGYSLGCAAGIVLGGVFAESPIFEKFFHPYIVLVQSMPKVALAPLIIVWFGYGIESKIVMVALICFFPVFVNTLTGIKQADPDLVDMLRAFSCSRLSILFQLKAPAAAGSIFAGLQIAVVLSLIGAVVAEFVSSRSGLGTMIQSAAQDLNTSMMLTGVFTLALMGLAGNLVVRQVYRKVVFWEARASTKTNTAGA